MFEIIFRGVFRIMSSIDDENAEDYCFRKKFHHECLTGSCIRLCLLGNLQTSTEFRMSVCDLGGLLLSILDSKRLY